MGTMLTRRDFAKRGMMCGGAFLVGYEEAAWAICSFPCLQCQPADPFSGGKQLGLVNFINPRPLEMDTEQGTELDGRLYTDLSKVSLQEPVIATHRFYVRTRVSRLLPDVKSWRERVAGLVEKPRQRAIGELGSAATALGLHLRDCAGD